jgi:hypothetical protein
MGSSFLYINVIWSKEMRSGIYQPSAILGYIYAVLYAATYRLSFTGFLRTDFPRIPFPEERAAFERLSQLGCEIIEAHLMRRWPDSELGRYRSDGDNMVREVRYVAAEKAIYINSSQRFVPVPPEVWAFHVGGYQVLLKYLKDRKGRTHRFGPKKGQDWPLMLDEIENVEKVVNILAFTIKQMKASTRLTEPLFLPSLRACGALRAPPRL